MARLVIAYVRNGEIDKAVAYVEDELARDPGNIRALLLRAELDLAQRNPDRAAERLREIIARNPELPIGHVSLARLQIALGDPAAAEETLRTGIGRVQDANSLNFLLAQLLEGRRAFDEAVEQYEAIVARGGAAPVVVNNLVSLIAEYRADDPGAMARADELSRRLRNSDIPEFQDTYGWVQFLRGDSRGALRSLSMAAEALPNNPIVQYHAGRVYAALEQHADARRHLEAALAIDPNFPKAESARQTLATLPQAGALQ